MRKDASAVRHPIPYSSDDEQPLPQTRSKRPTRPGQRKHLCPECGRAFLFANDVRKHRRIHTDERPFPCAQCGQRFRQAGCLKNHIASQHGTSDRFDCAQCDKSFPIKERLRLHMRIHSGVKPYACSACGCAFSRGGQLKQHLNTHAECRRKLHGATAERTANKPAKGQPATTTTANGMSCEFCSQTFARRLMLKKHTKECNQKPNEGAQEPQPANGLSRYYACDVCDASFMHQTQLRAHKRVHSGDRLYKCKVCSNAFAHLNVLKMHIRKHTGEKPFRCAICPNNTFSQLPHLKTHMRTIHKMDKSYHCAGCGSFFKMKHEHEAHACDRAAEAADATRRPGGLSKEQSARLTQMRLCMAVLLKRITSAERLKQLGFEKVLIDNVITAALKQADQPHRLPGQTSTAADDNDFDRFAVNVRHFLEWTLPRSVLGTFEYGTSTAIADMLHKLTKCD